MYYKALYFYFPLHISFLDSNFTSLYIVYPLVIIVVIIIFATFYFENLYTSFIGDICATFILYLPSLVKLILSYSCY